MEIIEWCNNNQGFISAILSLLTLIVSIIAIIISIVTSRLPFKKKLLVTCGSFIGIGFEGTGIHVTVTNVGNRNIFIKNLGIKVEGQVFTNMKTIEESRIMLNSGETTTQYFYNSEFSVFSKIQQNKKAYAYAEDSEGKTYKKYICKVKNLVK